MRALVASAMLLLQLQPFVGVALCSAVGGTDGDRMEAGCPMPQSGAGRPDYRTEAWSAASTWHDCVFAEACASSPIVLNSVRPGVVSLPPQFDPAIRPLHLFLPAESRSPPVPPPKA